MGSDCGVSPSRPRDLDLSELNRSLPGIEVNPAGAHSIVDPCFFGCLDASSGVKDHERVKAPGQFDEFYATCVAATSEMERYIEGHRRKIRELNANLPQATLGPKRFAKPGDVGRSGATTMLQFFSLKFTGNFPNNQPMLVYGFMAVRDDVEPLRNYIFNLTRENPCEVKPDSPMLPLMCPSRGMSVFFDSMIKYALKVKINGDDSIRDEHGVLIDGCIQFSEENITRDRKLKSRIDGPYGPVDIEYAFIRSGIESVVEIALIPKYFVGNRVKVTAFTSGYPDPILLYDGCVRKRLRFSSVVAVSLGGQLKINLEATIYNKEYEKEMVFEAQKYGSSKGKIKLVDVPREDEKYFCRREGRFVPKGHGYVVAFKVTWSTMGY